jgi:hypothetical protein
MKSQLSNVKTQKEKRPFLPYEDQIIQRYVENYGSFDFRKIIHFLPLRTVQQVKERWWLYLNPEVNKSEFTIEEDNILKEKYSELNGKWAKIKKYLPGRTDVQLKYRYEILKRREYSIKCD